MKIQREKLIENKGYLEGKLDAVDEKTASITTDYKKNVCRNFISLSPDQIDSRIGGETFYLTRKYDGELCVIFFNGSELFAINSGGTVRMGIPCMEEAKKVLMNAGVKSAIIAGELYVCEDKGRTRVFDVLSALSRHEELSRLCLAPFDILEMDDVPFLSGHYEEVHQKLKEIFKGSNILTPVSFAKVTSKAQVKETYAKWVEEEGAEGIIVRSELPLVYKVKPKHNMDVVVVGFTEGSGESKGQIRTLLLALMTEENKYQVIGRTGNGFSDDQKVEFYEKLSKRVIESDFIETDSSHVAFHMVMPEMVIELSFNDILYENATAPIKNKVLTLSDNKIKYHCETNGISPIFPIFVRERTDKVVDVKDVRFSQITDLLYVPLLDCQEEVAELPKSEIVFRAVYKKNAKEKRMVQKFLVWKTNKEEINSDYPAYVMHYTNFSSDRKEPLQRDIRISNSKDQILEITSGFMEENIKKGWEKVE